jgi:hypothetical protein
MQGAHGPCDHRWSGVTRRFAGCARSAARRAALLGGRGGGNLARPSPPLAPALPANPGFRNSRFHFRPPALLANQGFRNSRFHFRPPALLANLGFRNSRFHFRPPALLARFHFRPPALLARFHFRPPALLANPGFQNSRFHFRPITGHVYAQCAKSSLKREYLSV